jgi:diaminohydroxyphosphoribosylaminopyrimidine deaminase/5-amino-6-(5-phosphoribosylamino)uracil reductase
MIVPDRRFMRKALSLALKGIGCASPNPAVGCVIAQGERIVGEGWHEYALVDHAEIRALKEAGPRARGATAYVSLEPCSHHGRTPPCADSLIRAGIRRVVAATIDPNPAVSGKGLDKLRKAGVEVELGLFQEEADALIEEFACFVTTGRPLVIAKVGMSLDGRIGIRFRQRQKITSPQAGRFSQTLRQRSDAIMVGVGTILADDPELTYRGSGRKGRPLLRVILDGKLRTPPAARLFRSRPFSPVLIFCDSAASERRRRRLEQVGAQIIALRGSGGALSLHRILRELAKREVLGLLVEGGAETHWAFLSRRLVDKFYFIVAPLILGGALSVPSVAGRGYGTAQQAPRFAIRRRLSMGPDLVLETYPSYSKSLLSPWLHAASAPSGPRDSSHA